MRVISFDAEVVHVELDQSCQSRQQRHDASAS